ncbi:MAG: hypothetical protein N2491_06330 [Negativicutes bacterium]|nr:hypothetical protein [Negativicutes bacterium]
MNFENYAKSEKLREASCASLDASEPISDAKCLKCGFKCIEGIS